MAAIAGKIEWSSETSMDTTNAHVHGVYGRSCLPECTGTPIISQPETVSGVPVLTVEAASDFMTFAEAWLGIRVCPRKPQTREYGSSNAQKTSDAYTRGNVMPDWVFSCLKLSRQVQSTSTSIARCSRLQQVMDSRPFWLC